MSVHQKIHLHNRHCGAKFTVFPHVLYLVSMLYSVQLLLLKDKIEENIDYHFQNLMFYLGTLL